MFDSGVHFQLILMCFCYTCTYMFRKSWIVAVDPPKVGIIYLFIYSESIVDVSKLQIEEGCLILDMLLLLKSCRQAK